MILRTRVPYCNFKTRYIGDSVTLRLLHSLDCSPLALHRVDSAQRIRDRERSARPFKLGRMLEMESNCVNWLKSRSRWDLLINYHTKVTDSHPAFKPLGVKWLNRPLLLITWTEIRAKHTAIHFYWAFLESGTKGGWIGQSGQRVKFGTVPQKTGQLAAMYWWPGALAPGHQ